MKMSAFFLFRFFFFCFLLNVIFSIFRARLLHCVPCATGAQYCCWTLWLLSAAVDARVMERMSFEMKFKFQFASKAKKQLQKQAKAEKLNKNI